MKIIDIRATTVTVPLEAPLRHANGCHWGRFVRTIVEVETDNGLIGLGEMGGGGESAEAVFRALKQYLVGHDPARLEEMRFLHRQPDRVALQQPHAGAGGAGVRLPRHPRPGVGRAGVRHPRRRLRDRVPFASYLLLSLPRPPTDGRGAHHRPAGRATRATLKRAVRLHDAQAEGRRLPAGLRARVLPRARRGASRRQRPLRSQRRLVHRAGDPLRPGDRGSRQRLPRGSGLRPERHAPRPREGARAARDQHRRRQLRAARGQRAEYARWT